MGNLKDKDVIEWLLRPRYKVIADFPFKPYPGTFPIGQIITLPPDKNHCARDEKGDPVFWCDWHKYPHIFKPLQWWEDRKLEDMPEYVKYFDISLYYPIGRVCKTENAPFNDTMCAENFLPATETEYLDYLTSTK